MLSTRYFIRSWSYIFTGIYYYELVSNLSQGENLTITHQDMQNVRTGVSSHPSGNWAGRGTHMFPEGPTMTSTPGCGYKRNREVPERKRMVSLPKINQNVRRERTVMESLIWGSTGDGNSDENSFKWLPTVLSGIQPLSQLDQPLGAQWWQVKCPGTLRGPRRPLHSLSLHLLVCRWGSGLSCAVARLKWDPRSWTTRVCWELHPWDVHC